MSKKFNVIVVTDRHVRDLTMDALNAFNIAKSDTVVVRHISPGQGIGAFPADMIIVALDLTWMDMHEKAMTDAWIREVLRLRLLPGGLWIEAIR